jgi:hypothetical protein
VAQNANQNVVQVQVSPQQSAVRNLSVAPSAAQKNKVLAYEKPIVNFKNGYFFDFSDRCIESFSGTLRIALSP